ncbi:beta-Ala-His dipeptidase [Peptostreptococcus faecalis]|uniref:beta-Ala-His dipeptidase n=1 Tax=Peptostreptococcus faecalis TaxID=2045015 RepID=UPI000C7DE3DB|nr:beta-Ala-His dipeptidase [Peptostreptococcus faecalis]
MVNITKGLFPEIVFKNFENISQIPRSSGHEKEVSDYIFNFAKELGLEAYQDESYNLVVKKSSTNSSETPSTLMLQAHMDMVAESDPSTEHDFQKDPIKLIVKDNILKADKTTLGADNGIGVAYMMSILESDDIIHPNLECVFTVNEENGLIGVNAMSLYGLKSTNVINLDSEEDDSILVGSAGAVNSTITLRKEYKPSNTKNVALEINVNGLLGGHSGMDIEKQRGNANIIMGRILNSITYPYDLFNISGGSKRNTIPRSCEAIISINNDELEKIVRQIQKASAKIQKEFYAVDPKLKIELRRSAPTEFKVFTDNCKSDIIKLLTLIPDGVMSWSKSLKNTVESSTNFAVVRETNTHVEFISMTRSSVQSKKDHIKVILSTIARTTGVPIEFSDEYDPWEHKVKSKLEKLSVDIYAELFGVYPHVVAMHCGLESGVLINKLDQEAEAISIGPNMFDVHTPNEYVEIDSVGKIWNYLLELLKSL